MSLLGTEEERQMSQQDQEERAAQIQREIDANTRGPRCPFCRRDIKAGIDIQGMYIEKDGNSLCCGTISFVHCQRCGELLRTLFDPSHRHCQVEPYGYAPVQLMI
jgi:hypothetical protein